MEGITNFYESDLLRRATGDTLRPGGYRLTDLAVQNCGFQRGDRILDVGCGYGATVHRLRSHFNLEAYGVDPSAKLLTIGKQLFGILPLRLGSGEDIPFEDSSMDGVLAECSFSLMEDMEGALEEMYRVLKPFGRLIIHDVYARNPQGLADLLEFNLSSCLRNALIKEQLEKILKNTGFRVIQWQDHSALLVKLTMELIMTYGSMSEFWRKSTDCIGDTGKIQAALKKAQVGYFQLIAVKG